MPCSGSTYLRLLHPITHRFHRHRLWFDCDWLEDDLRRRWRHDGGRRGFLRLAHDQMPEYLFGDLQRSLELGDSPLIDLEILEDVRAFLLMLDLIGEL